MGFVAAKCTQCGANIDVDNSKDAGICTHCDTAVPKTKMDQIDALINSGQKIQAIKLVRDVSGLSLKESKDFVENEYSPTNSSGTKKAGCYIATAVYNSYDCPEVWILRRYRDYEMSKTKFARLFIHIYYKTSPTFVKLFAKTHWFKLLGKNILDKFIPIMAILDGCQASYIVVILIIVCYIPKPHCFSIGHPSCNNIISTIKNHNIPIVIYIK